MAEEDNTSAVLHAKLDIRLEQRPIPVPGPNDVLVAVHSVGICGSDVHYWTDMAIGDFIVNAPMVLGHESSGTVKAVGQNVKHVSKGDRVALEPGYSCRMCDYCKRGRYNLCPQMQFAATPPVHGTLTKYYAHPADFCYKLPDNVSYEEGALLEPLSVGVHACQRAGIGIGSTVLVCGAGPIGLVNLLVAKAMGASRVCVTDIDANRLRIASAKGADAVVQVAPDTQPEQVATQVQQALGVMPDRTIECSGAESSLQAAIYATRAGGCIVLVGLGKPMAHLPIVNAAVREIDIRGVFRYANWSVDCITGGPQFQFGFHAFSYPLALDLIATGRIRVADLVTHRYSLADTVKAFEHARTAADNAIKVIITVADN